MIGKQVAQGPIDSHCHTGRAGIVVLGDCAARHFVVIADKGRGDLIEYGFHPVPIAIINKGSNTGAVLLNFHQSIFGIIREQIGVRANDSCRHIPVGIMLIRIAREGGHGMAVIGIGIPIGDCVADPGIVASQAAVVQPGPLLRRENASVECHFVQPSIQLRAAIRIRANRKRIGGISRAAGKRQRMNRASIHLDIDRVIDSILPGKDCVSGIDCHRPAIHIGRAGAYPETEPEIVPEPKQEPDDEVVKVRAQTKLFQLVEQLEIPELSFKERLTIANQLRVMLVTIHENAPPREALEDIAFQYFHILSKDTLSS